MRMPSDHPALYRSLHGVSWLPSTRWMFSASNSGGPPPTTWMYRARAAVTGSSSSHGRHCCRARTNRGRRILLAQNSGYNRAILRPGRATEQTIPTGPGMKARYRKSDGRLTDTEANKPPGSHHGSPECQAASALPRPRERKGAVLNCRWSKRAPFGLIQYSKVKEGK